MAASSRLDNVVPLHTVGAGVSHMRAVEITDLVGALTVDGLQVGAVAGHHDVAVHDVAIRGHLHGLSDGGGRADRDQRDT